MKLKYILFMLFIFLFCQGVDVDPPKPSTINDTRTKLILNVSGFLPSSRVYVRFWQEAKPIAYPSSYQLYTDADGRLLTEIYLSLNTQAASVLVYVDDDKDGSLTAADFGYYQSFISVDNVTKITEINIPWQSGTLNDYMSSATLPTSGQNTCVYMPPGYSTYQSSMNNNLPDYPEFGESLLTISDWFPVTILDTGGVVQSVPLPASWLTPSVNEVCLP